MRRFLKFFARLSALLLGLSLCISPLEGFSSRFMHRTSVLFPAPDMPIIPYMSPSFMVSVTFLSASTSPVPESKVLLTFFSSITVVSLSLM